MNISQVLHSLPTDMQNSLSQNQEVYKLWNSLTPLAQNEWICWVTIVQQDKTRIEHINRMIEEIAQGKKRPCCWPGCPHRNKNAMKYFC